MTGSSRVRVALLISPDSFEHFFTESLGIDRERYAAAYRNDFVWTYASGLRSHGVDVVAYVPSLAGSHRVRADDGFEVRFLALPQVWTTLRPMVTRAVTPIERYAGEMANAALLLPGLRRAMDDDDIDVLYVQEYWTGRFDLLVHAAGVPVVAGEHGGSSGRHLHVLKRRALHRAAAITAQSTAERDRLRKRYECDAELITNGIDSSFFTPPATADRPPRMLVAARLVDAQKRVSDVISALALLPGEWGLDIVGRGPDEEALREQVADLGLEARVEFHGWLDSREDLRERYRRCGVFVLPSTWEAVTLAVLEAMACGAPAVVTPLPTFRDLIRDGVNGVITPPHSPAELAGRVLSAYADRERIGTAARRTVERDYDRDTTMARLAVVLRRAAAGQGPLATVGA